MRRWCGVDPEFCRSGRAGLHRVFAPVDLERVKSDRLNSAYSDAALDRQQRRNFGFAILALVMVIATGTVGFWWLEEQWDAWDALFFTCITITTVGYGDYGLDMRGEIFALFLMISGIATCTYAFSQMVQLAVSQRLNWRKRMLKHIAHLEDHFIVCGNGRVGRAICERFEESGTPVVVVDPSEDRCEWARQHGHFVVHGDAGKDEVLMQANVERCRGLVACTPDESENLVITLTARSHNEGCTIIARAESHDAVAKFQRAGADRVVAPSLFGGHQIATMLVRPHLADFLTQMCAGDDDYQLSEIMIDPGSPLAGQTPETYGQREPGLVFVALKRTGEPTRIRPDATESFAVGDVVIVAGQLDAIARARSLAQAA